MKLIGLILGVILLILGAIYYISPRAIVQKPIAPIYYAAIPTPIPTLDATGIFNSINDYRVSKGLHFLVWNERICAFANIRLEQIHTDFSHTGYSPEYKQFYNPVWTGENLVRVFNTDTNKDIIQTWLDSPEHLANIVDPNYTQTCVVIDQYEGNEYAVQELASDF